MQLNMQITTLIDPAAGVSLCAHKDVADDAPPLMVAPAVLMPERAMPSELEKALLRVAPALMAILSDAALTCLTGYIWPCY